ncbi:hypothetical protein [Pontiella agarivorans]|uniref:Uncharacterized protein n=1 Tax=Pontiella agarivorans TaxID=3038953 RepID=A0ABU5MX10_9BACT|nr:hypothetical protein [Pontiella agarivorans]MDZ8118496.1 hypothetical protein [Pontiella agarivorans]
MKHLSIILFISISLLTPIVQGKDEAQSRHDKIYAFQHKLTPSLLFKTDGRFFADLENGSKSKLIGIAKESVDSTFAKALTIQPVKNKDAYTITFQKPAEPPECYHVLLIKSDDEYLYYTLEKGIDVFGQGNPSFLCQWTPGGNT